MRAVESRLAVRLAIGTIAFALGGALVSTGLAGQNRSVEMEWRYYGGDSGSRKYSPLDDINRDNLKRLSVVWTWATGDAPREEFATRPGQFQNTPLMIDGVLYASTPYNRVVALDPETGVERWSYDPKAYEDGQPPNGTGFVHRGVAAWRDGERLRIILASRYRLVALDAVTGEPVDGFGTNGVVDLSQGLVWDINKKHYTNTSPPVIYKNLIIVGNGVGDRLMYRNDPPGDVRAFDAKTGKLVWKFNTIPQSGEFGNETWSDDSWKITGHTNVWAPITVDDVRGLVYLPVTTPSNDFYGGRRPGANLFAESLVCLDAATGTRKWHYQIVHHGLWDYDLPAAPVLATINAGGQPRDVVVQVTKQGFTFVFDRVTGDPIWPIEERPVGQSDVPGEHSWPTQPIPTKPAPFAAQGVSLDDAFDVTPALKEQAMAVMKQYRLGPLYTPPSLQGTLMRPGVMGGANWGGAAFDPESGRLYVKSSGLAHVASLRRVERREDLGARAEEVDAEYMPGTDGRQRERTSGEGGTNADFPNGLPLNKPPWGHMTAIDLNRGEIVWRVPFGDAPWLREHPALQGLSLPHRLGALGPAGAIITKSGLLFAGSGDRALYALDARTGEELWRHALAEQVTGTPMTYRTKSGRQFIVFATTGTNGTKLVAMALGEDKDPGS